MDVGSWCNSGNRHTSWSRPSFLESEYDVPFNMPVTGSKVPIWSLLWRKIMKEKKKIFDNSTTLELAYDQYSYARNFDEGSLWDDPDDLSCSFSARFAVPSRIFQKMED